MYNEKKYSLMCFSLGDRGWIEQPIRVNTVQKTVLTE